MTATEPMLGAMPASHFEETLHASFLERFARDIARARDRVPTHPYWSSYTDNDLRIAEVCTDSVISFVRKALPKQDALQQHVLVRLLRKVDAWPTGASVNNFVEPKWHNDPSFKAMLKVCMLSEATAPSKVGWPGDAAPNDVLRWMTENGDSDVRFFSFVLRDRADVDGWLPLNAINLETGKSIFVEKSPAAMASLDAFYQVDFDPNGYKLMGLALVYLAWREVLEDSRTALGAARFAWTSVRNDNEESLSIMARGALAEALHPPTDADSVRELVAELRAVLPVALDAAGFIGDVPATEAHAIVTESGILRWDEGFARYLCDFGGHGKALAEKVRKSARVRFETYQAKADRAHAGGALWALWADLEQHPACLRFGRALAYTLWVERVRARFERLARKPPALVMAVAEPVAHLFSRVRREEERDGQRTLRLPGEVLVKVANTAATIGSETLNALIIDQGVKLFGSLASHRVLRWQIFTAHRQALEGDADPRVIRVDGGWSSLAHDVLGMRGNKAAEQVRNIIEAMHATELPLPPHGNYSRLLIREAHTPRGRGKQWIKLVLGTALLPDYVQELQAAVGHTLEGRRATRLVPVLDVPPVIGRDNEHGAQATFSMLLVAYMRDRARELVERGGVVLDERTLDDLAKRAGVPRDIVRPLLDRWTQDGDDGPAFLKVVESSRYTLGDTHAVPRAFIEDGGRRELEGSRAGEKGATKRRAAISGRNRRSKSPA
jgi:hypothetical protein